MPVQMQIDELPASKVLAQMKNNPLPMPPGGGVDYFLKVEGLPGESVDDKRPDDIRLEAFQFQERQTGQTVVGDGLGAGRVEMGCFTFQARIDRAAPRLFLACATGQRFNKMVELVVRKAGSLQQEYLRYTFTDVVFSRVNVVADKSSDLPLVSFDMFFAQVEVVYKPQKNVGTLGNGVKAMFNVKTMTNE
jgi:type VI secretion system secreted protein Hcp